jgi:hypothetical protein
MLGKLVKAIIYFFVLSFIAFIGMDLLISDFGPGETSIDRQIAIAGYVILSVLVIYLLRKLLKKL